MRAWSGGVSRRQFVVAATAAGLIDTMPSFAASGDVIAERIKCDVLVYGATPAGIAAAVVAARHGHKVVLAEIEDHIGGILSNGLTNTDLDPAHRAAVGGFFNEFTDRVIAHYLKEDGGTSGLNVQSCHNGFYYEPSVAEAIFNGFVAEHSAHLRLMLQHEMKQAISDGTRVKGGIFERRDGSGRHVQVDAEVLIDATYEGDLAAMAKAEYRLGRESKEDFHEPHAGKIYMSFGSPNPLPGSTGAGDKAIQAYCFRFTATSDPKNRVPVEKPEGYDRPDYRFLLEDVKSGKLTKLSHVFGTFPMPKGKMEFNNLHPQPGTGVPSESLDLAEDCWDWPEATLSRRKEIYRRYLSHNVGMLWMLQNDPAIPESLRTDAQRYGWCRDEFTRNRNLPRQVYVREGRRIIGEYLLTEHDGNLVAGWERTQVQPTSIALVEWQFDSHACHRYDPAHPGVREGYTFVEHAIFQVPYGVVVPKSVDGLLVPVACSATHIAYNALRMEPVFMALGEACGHAAHLAVRDHVDVRNIAVERLQQFLLANGGAITYFNDLKMPSEAYIPCQWLGARGMNTGYSADLDKALTRVEGAQRLQRILRSLNHSWTPPADDEGADPLLARHLMEWLQQAGFSSAGETGDSIKLLSKRTTALTCAEFSVLAYRIIGPPRQTA